MGEFMGQNRKLFRGSHAIAHQPNTAAGGDAVRGRDGRVVLQENTFCWRRRRVLLRGPMVGGGIGDVLLITLINSVFPWVNGPSPIGSKNMYYG